MIISLLKVAATSLVSLVVLFVLTKIMGRKQMSELSMFDYIIGISIGSIAAEMATNIEEYEKPLTAMIIYAIFAFVISIIQLKSYKTEKFISGTPVILYKDKKIYKNELKKSKFTVTDLISQARLNGFYNLYDIKLAVLEPNGKISFLPTSSTRPACPQDMNIKPPQEEMGYDVIIDGKIMDTALENSCYDKIRLENELKNQNVNSLSDVLLATVDSYGTLNVYLNAV